MTDCILEEMLAAPEQLEIARARLKNRIRKSFDLKRMINLARKNPDDLNSEERAFHDAAMGFDNLQLPFMGFKEWKANNIA